MIGVPTVVEGVVVVEVGAGEIALHAEIGGGPIARDFAAAGNHVAFGTADGRAARYARSAGRAIRADDGAAFAGGCAATCCRRGL